MGNIFHREQSYILIMYYSKVFLQYIVLFLSLGYVVSKAGVGENKNIFSAELDILRPWEECEELNDRDSLCGDDLFAENAELANIEDQRYIMTLKIGSDKKAFRVSYIQWMHNI